MDFSPGATPLDLIGIQTNVVGGGGDIQPQGTGVLGAAITSPPVSDEPVSPGRSYDTVTAPGILRQRGIQSPIEVPAPSGLPSFDSYIQTMVRSELASQGIPVTETFQMQDVVKNTGAYFKEEGAELAKEKQKNRLMMPA
jgi:hypothetical protein